MHDALYRRIPRGLPPRCSGAKASVCFLQPIVSGALSSANKDNNGSEEKTQTAPEFMMVLVRAGMRANLRLGPVDNYGYGADAH